MSRWAGHFWFAHFAAPLCVLMAAWMTEALLDGFGLGGGGWAVGGMVGLLLFLALAYSLMAAVLSGMAALREWSVLRRRVLGYG